MCLRSDFAERHRICVGEWVPIDKNTPKVSHAAGMKRSVASQTDFLAQQFPGLCGILDACVKDFRGADVMTLRRTLNR